MTREGEERESEDRGSEPRILTLAEVARYLRVHPSTITRLLKKNEFPGFKVGRDWRFNLEHIDKLQFGRELRDVLENQGIGATWS